MMITNAILISEYPALSESGFMMNVISTGPAKKNIQTLFIHKKIKLYICWRYFSCFEAGTFCFFFQQSCQKQSESGTQKKMQKDL